MNPYGHVAEQDNAILLDYLDGLLAEEDKRALEMRLLSEPALAATFRDLAEMDFAARVALPARERGRVLGWKVWFPLAAAAAVVATLSVKVWRNESASLPFECQVAALASGVDYPEYSNALGLDPRLAPNGQRGPGTGGVDAHKYYAEVQEVERRRSENALAVQPAPIRAGYYVLSFRTSLPCSAIVVSVPQVGRATLEFPLEGTDSAGRLFAPGATHRLPRDILMWVSDPGQTEHLELSPGFLVPIGAKRVRLLLGLRGASSPPELLVALRAFVAELPEAGNDDVRARETSERVARWLEEHAYKVSELQIDEP